MDRFNEYTPNNTRHLANLFGEDVRTEQCDRCHDFHVMADMRLLKEDGQLPELLCSDCYTAFVREFLEREDPPCTCTQTDVDLFNARGCEAHDRVSGFNVRQGVA